MDGASSLCQTAAGQPHPSVLSAAPRVLASCLSPLNSLFLALISSKPSFPLSSSHIHDHSLFPSSILYPCSLPLFLCHLLSYILWQFGPVADGGGQWQFGGPRYTGGSMGKPWYVEASFTQHILLYKGNDAESSLQ